ncbi:hypothetical protein EV651_10120 [Kribbella sp. VKM Ac-2571]|uniref:hypothetical protein n=1 Tax=Kribbella sp. VKM Ac-2571 TaxID=2512222 RepID=UPI00105C7B89|nr:hypothetical protein [Kribbella sp. VKM Ac-2571]TDO68986.1 hypothetical protein EV651_10120 [Kribbella sp. VKM Ac-2571]
MPDLNVGELRKHAQPVTRWMRLSDVRLKDLRCVGTSPLLKGPFKVETTVEVSCKQVDDTMTVGARYRVEAVSEATDDRPQAWTVRLQMVADYVGREGEDEAPPQFTKDERRAFGLLVGLVTVHPYAREVIQSTSGRMGYPPFSAELLESTAAAPDDATFRLLPGEFAEPDEAD